MVLSIAHKLPPPHYRHRTNLFFFYYRLVPLLIWLPPPHYQRRTNHCFLHHRFVPLFVCFSPIATDTVLIFVLFLITGWSHFLLAFLRLPPPGITDTVLIVAFYITGWATQSTADNHSSGFKPVATAVLRCFRLNRAIILTCYVNAVPSIDDRLLACSFHVKTISRLHYISNRPSTVMPY